MIIQTTKDAIFQFFNISHFLFVKLKIDIKIIKNYYTATCCNHHLILFRNMDSSACHFSTMVGIVAFLASIGFLVGEWFFEQMSSIKTRKHYVIFDMAFSGIWRIWPFNTLAFLIRAHGL